MELWRLPHQRKISLRFLAFYLLHMEIQVRPSLSLFVCPCVCVCVRGMCVVLLCAVLAALSRSVLCCTVYGISYRRAVTSSLLVACVPV